MVNSWDKGVESDANVILTSIPSIFDPAMAPPGMHAVHCYSAGNEPFDIWEGVKYKVIINEPPECLFIYLFSQISLSFRPLTGPPNMYYFVHMIPYLPFTFREI